MNTRMTANAIQNINRRAQMQNATKTCRLQEQRDCFCAVILVQCPVKMNQKQNACFVAHRK
jgi:hypothetical protein